jgi:hypothetical protein
MIMWWVHVNPPQFAGILIGITGTSIIDILALQQLSGSKLF